jgi:hypothetical protein
VTAVHKVQQQAKEDKVELLTVFCGDLLGPSMISTIAALELAVRQSVHFSSPVTDNNSFIPKKWAFDKAVEKSLGDLRDTTIFLGSSFFARGLDCTEKPPIPCLNISLDGGDAQSYETTYVRWLMHQPMRAVVMELSQIVLADFDYSGPAIKGYIQTPIDHMTTFSQHGLTPEFKQSLKNQIDARLLWSGLNFYSRRNRLSDWPNLFAHKLWSADKTKASINQVEAEVMSYNKPNQQKLKALTSVVYSLNQRSIPVYIVATPDIWQGEVDGIGLQDTVVYRLMEQWQKEGKIHFVSGLTRRGLSKSDISDDLGQIGRAHV